MKWFSKPSANDLAKQELDEAKRSILSHHSAAEYHDAMIAALSSRIERLESMLFHSEQVTHIEGGYRD